MPPKRMNSWSSNLQSLPKVSSLPRRTPANSPAPANKSPAWFDPRQRTPAFVLQTHQSARRTWEPPRTNYFRIWWIAAGSGTFAADAAQHAFQPQQLLFFVPYQHLRISVQSPLVATEILFHANFLCVETFHAETGCSGVLFNDLYGPPVVSISGSALTTVNGILQQLIEEQNSRGLAYEDASLSYLKILLIQAARQKVGQPQVCRPGNDFRHPLLEPLRELIEHNYCRLHAPSDYAELLHVTPKTLGRCVREHLGKTLTDLIRERILTHAKWQLLHTLRPIKEIAAEIGFRDELYFSRLFKQQTGVSPKFFREFETEIRGGSNLSMTLSSAPIRE